MATKKKTSKRTTAAKKRSVPEKEWDFKVTVDQLTFLRDLFGVLLPSPTDDVHTPVCQALAVMTKREEIESALWDKLVDLCEAAGVVIGDKKEVPDYAIIPISIPQLGVVTVDRTENDED